MRDSSSLNPDAVAEGPVRVALSLSLWSSASNQTGGSDTREDVYAGAGVPKEAGVTKALRPPACSRLEQHAKLEHHHTHGAE